ncbi:hypothetical protein ACGFZK_03015 [Streptomyces sp. NPDC048257]|uniref:hypothetical protein n=1 Tax=Streptomyces sp. NPDC048257 TaxID=3365526 RepID=UPI00371E4BDE
MLERKRRKSTTDVTFVLPEDIPPGPVSVVGTFNDWRPGAHVLVPRSDGKRAVTVALPARSTHSFRYLGAGDHWFDEADADGHEEGNSRLRL